MKFKIYLIFALSILGITKSKAQWKMVYDSGSYFSGIYVFSDGEHVIARNDFGLMVTTDLGKTWKQVSTSDLAQHVAKIIRKDSILLAGSDSGVLASSDSGLNWKKISTWPFNDKFGSITLNGNNILAFNPYKRVIISKDNGYNWDSSNIGLPSTLAQSGTPPTLRYCSGFLSVKNNISVFSDYNQYISYDHGEHWNFKNASSPVTSGVNSYSNLCGAFQNKIFISKDSAGTWKQIFTSVQSGNVYSLSSRNEFVIAGIDNEGVVISKDSGEHWVYINDGLSSLGIRSVTIGKNFIYCGTSYGKVFRRPLAEAVGLKDEKPTTELLKLKIFPNPLLHSATIEFGRQLRNGNFQLYDMNGKQLQLMSNINTDKILLQRNGLPAGIYIYLLNEDGRKLANGKIEIE